MRSYSISDLGIIHKIKEAFVWYRQLHDSKRLRAKMAVTVGRLRSAEELIERYTSLKLRNLRIMEVGPGQLMLRSAYLSCWNEVFCIDLDIIPIGFKPSLYIYIATVNGMWRALKTLCRKLLGIDRKVLAELQKQLAAPLMMNRIHRITGDAAFIAAKSSSFDFSCSFSVFEHLSNPEYTIDEMIRILKPGGVLYITVHLYTSIHGHHDFSLYYKHESEPACLWSHLRPGSKSAPAKSVYLNKFRLSEWEKLFLSKCAGVHFEYIMYGKESLEPALQEIRRSGELLDFDTKELLTTDFVVIWKKIKREIASACFAGPQ